MSKLESAEEFNERQRAAFRLHCRHHRGVYHHPVCEAGVNVRQHVGGPDFGWMARIPCCGKDGKDRVPCEQYAPHTPEAIAERERRQDEAVARMLATLPLCERIKRGNPNGGKGSDPCPSGCGGTVSWTCASLNLHVWMRCSTPDCIAFME